MDGPGGIAGLSVWLVEGTWAGSWQSPHLSLNLDGPVLCPTASYFTTKHLLSS